MFADQPWSQVIVPNVLEVIVPIATLDRLNTIAELCFAESPTRAVTPAASVAAVPEFVAQIEALPADAIPPACRADLLAVAAAVQAQR